MFGNFLGLTGVRPVVKTKRGIGIDFDDVGIVGMSGFGPIFDNHVHARHSQASKLDSLLG